MPHSKISAFCSGMFWNPTVFQVFDRSRVNVLSRTRWTPVVVGPFFSLPGVSMTLEKWGHSTVTFGVIGIFKKVHLAFLGARETLRAPSIFSECLKASSWARCTCNISLLPRSRQTRAIHGSYHRSGKEIGATSVVKAKPIS